MIGYHDIGKATDDTLLSASRKHKYAPKLIAAGVSALAVVALIAGATMPAKAPVDHSDAINSAAISSASVDDAPLPTAAGWHGVSLGGWLVMEINPAKRSLNSPMDLRPKWMYDQIFANSELDFVTNLRKEHGEAYAVTTMRNHWSGYITADMLDRAVKLGVDTVRIPVGYWIMDAPIGGSSPLEYGISPEGFVTGGLNHLLDMLKLLKERGMVALVDIHAMPCNSACVSDGLYCALPLAFAPPGFAPIGDMARCGGGTYPTTRTPTETVSNWGDVGIAAIDSLAEWLAALPESAQAVAAFQLANEPVLGAGDVLDSAVNAFYERALLAARAHLPKLPLVLSFMSASPAVLTYLAAARLKHGSILVDHHYYLNWQAPLGQAMPWGEIHRRACTAEAEGAVHNLEVFQKAKQPTIVGEWSLAVNHDEVFDLSDKESVSELKKLFVEQLKAFGAKSMVVGSFFWTLRMGSGWDPRPTDDHPEGFQLEGSSALASLSGYPFAVWSLLEMAEAGVAAPLDGSHDDACADVDMKDEPWFNP